MIHEHHIGLKPGDREEPVGVEDRAESRYETERCDRAEMRSDTCGRTRERVRHEVCGKSLDYTAKSHLHICNQRLGWSVAPRDLMSTLSLLDISFCERAYGFNAPELGPEVRTIH